MIIGSEGTLGIITKVKIYCPFIEKNKITVLFKVSGFDEILKLHKLIKKKYTTNISVIEYFDN